MNQKHGYSDFIPAFQEENREKTLKACRQYMHSHIPEKTPYVRLFSQQLRYISPLFWIWQIIVFLGVMILAVAVPKGEMFAGELLYYTGPLVGILAYPEMFRDLFYDMSEIENSCKNNSATLFVMRLLIVGVMNLLLLTLLAVVTSTSWDDSFLRTVIFGMTPFLWIHLITLPLLRVTQIRSRIGALVLSACLTAAAWMFGAMRLRPMEMEYGSMLLWTASLAMAAILLCVELGMLIKERKSGEEDILWN